MSIRDYKITDAQFSEKGVIAAPDTLTGTAAENKGVFDRFAREIIAPQFNSIVDKFADMEESANNWSDKEAQRVQQENARQSAEQGRVSAEGQRATNETARLSAEENRISAENDRVTAETARVNAENKRDSAEKSRVSAENARNVWQTYDAAKTYVPGNKVSFGGSSYVCTAETVGHEPTDTAYWLLIAQKGMDGAGADDLRQINNALDAIDPTKVTTKATPADGDGVMIADNADGGKAKRLLWSSVKTALGKLFVPLARTVNGKTLVKDVTLTGENIAVSTADSTPISGAVKYRTNPNLLDNWFFGRPVNQKNGYIVPAGKPYYLEYPTISGYTSAPVVATPHDSYYNIVIDGVTYAVNASDAIPGYCAAGYTVDRWYSSATSKTVKVESDGLAISDTADFGAFIQRIEYQGLLGKTVTFSVLAKCLAQGAQSPYITVMNGGGSDYSYEGYDMIKAADNYVISSTTVTLSNTAPTGGYFFVDCVGMAGSSFKILAAKLELGSTQTLAHKEGDRWILNEIPDFGEQLRSCQRYCRVYKAGTTLPCLAYPQMDGGWYASAGLPTNEMRTIPTNNLADGKKVAITDLDGADATHDDMSMTNWGQNENMLCLRISGGSHGVLTSKFPYWIKLKEDLILSADL